MYYELFYILLYLLESTSWKFLKDELLQLKFILFNSCILFPMDRPAVFNHSPLNSLIFSWDFFFLRDSLSRKRLLAQKVYQLLILWNVAGLISKTCQHLIFPPYYLLTFSHTIYVLSLLRLWKLSIHFTMTQEILLGEISIKKKILHITKETYKIFIVLFPIIKARNNSNVHLQENGFINRIFTQ